MAIKDKNIYYVSFSSVDDAVSKRISDTLSALRRESGLSDGVDASSSDSQADAHPMRLVECGPVEELVNEDLFLMMLLWKKCAHFPCSKDEIVLLLKCEKQDARVYVQSTLPRLVRRNYLTEVLIDGQPCYEISVPYDRYAKLMFSATLQEMVGCRTFLDYVASLYDGKMIDDNDLGDLFYWLNAIRDRFEDEP